MSEPTRRGLGFHETTEEQIVRQLRQMNALHQISLGLSSALSLQAMAKLLLEKIDLLLHYPFSTFCLLNKDTGLLELLACRNLEKDHWQSLEVQAETDHARILFDEQKPLVIANIQSDPTLTDRDFIRKQGFISCVRVPLAARGDLLGVLSLYTKDERRFTDEEIEFFNALASQVALAIYSFDPYMLPQSSDTEEPASEAVRTISYDIRTRLTSLMGYAGMIRDQIFGEVNLHQKRGLEKVMKSAYELLTITEKLETLRARDLRREVLTGSRPLSEAVEEFERKAIIKALQTTGFNQTKAATLLGTTRNILRYKIKKLGINVEDPGRKQ